MSRSTRSSTSRPTSFSFSSYDLRIRSHKRVANFVRRPIRELEIPGVDGEDAADLELERFEIPLLVVRLPGRVGLHQRVEDLLGEIHQVFARADGGGFAFLVLELDLALEDLAAQRVDVLALLVHHVVVFEEVLADGEVLRLDLLLRALDGARHHAVLDRHAFFHAELLHQAGNAIRAEDAHQVVFERKIEAGGARIALTAGAAAQLVVDTPRFVPFGGDDVQSVERDHLVVLRVGQPLEVLEDALVLRLRDAVERVEVVEVREVARPRRSVLPLWAGAPPAARPDSAGAP